VGTFVKCAGESRPGVSLPGRLSVWLAWRWAVAVVAHDGGARLICADWVPHDDGSDVNGSCRLQSSVTHDLVGRIMWWLIGSWQVRSLTAPTPVLAGPAKCVPLLGLFEGGQRPAPAGELVGDRDVGGPIEAA
jgi:hypothetical protein